MPSDARDMAPAAVLKVARSRPLVWALIGSAALHTMVIALYFGSRGLAHAAPGGNPLLQVILVAAPQTEPVVLAAAAPAPSALPVVSEPLPPRPRPAAAQRATTVTPPAPVPKPASPNEVREVREVRIDAGPVVDRTRLGDFVDRQLREFPAEIDYGPKMERKISVPYPPAALAAGREDTVAVWFVVNADGTADDISIAEGSDEFATVVIAALRDSRFIPAHNNLVPIAFPLALEFRFALDVPSAPPSAASAGPATIQ